MAADVFDRVGDLCELHEALHVHEFGEDGPLPVHCQAHLEGLFGGHPHAPVQGPDGVGALGVAAWVGGWVEWSGVVWSGVEWSGVGWSGVEWGGEK